MKKVLLGLLLALAPSLALAQNVGGRAANGAATSGNPVWVCGSDGTDCRALKTDSVGTLQTSTSIPAPVGVNCLSGCSSTPQTSAYFPVTQYNSIAWPFTVTPSGTFTVSVSTVTTSPVAATIPVSLSGATSLSGSVGVTQVTSPWTVRDYGTVTTSLTGAVSVFNSVGVTQTTSPWAVNGQVSVGGTVTVSPTVGTVVLQPVLSHTKATSLSAALTVKASAGNLFGFNCTAVIGGAAGFCIAYNSATIPAPSTNLSSSVVDTCYFDTTARGCSLVHVGGPVAYSTGIIILVTTATSPFTYTTGTASAFISADYN